MAPWDVLIQLLPIIGGAAGLLSWWRTRHSSDRTAWWDRMRWSAELALRGNEQERRVGIDGLHVISSTGMTKKIDRTYFEVIYSQITEADSTKERRILEGGDDE